MQNGEKINSVGKTGHAYAKEWHQTHSLHHTQTMKLLEENIRKELFVIDLSSDLGGGGDMTPKATKTKINKWEYIKRVQILKTAAMQKT